MSEVKQNTYICHRSFEEKIYGGEPGTTEKFHVGEIFPQIGAFIAIPPGKAICTPTSSQGHRYFAINNDGQGLVRGALTYAIAYSERERIHKNGHVFRFSEEEIETLERDWKHFLRDDPGVILFNHDFFTAPVEELKRLAEAINITI